jgi:hypothetical protein
MRLATFVVSLFFTAALSVAAHAKAPAAAPAKKGAAPAETPFTDEEHSAEGLRFKNEPHETKLHTKHGSFHKKPVVKHQAFEPSHFRKHAPNGGKVKLPHGTEVSAADWHAAVNHAERALNSVGHSLRHPGPKEKLVHHDSGHADVKVASARFAKMHKPPKTAHKKAELKHRHEHHAQLVAARRALYTKHAKAAPKGKTAAKTGAKGAAQKGPPPEVDVISGASATVPSGEMGPAKAPTAVPPPPPELMAAIAKAVAEAPKNPVTKSNVIKSWDLRAGDPHHFSAYLTGKVETTGDKDKAVFHAESEAGGSAFGKSHELLKVSADFTASRLEEHEALLEVKAAGSTVFTLDKKSKEMWSKGERVEKAVDVSATIPLFSIGIIGVNAKVGVQGAIGVDYGVSIGPGIVSAHVTPYEHTAVYVQASVNVLIAEAGAIGKLTLINDDLALEGSVALVPNRTPRGDLAWGVLSKLSLHNNMEMLNGDVSAFVKLYFPCWHSILPAICNKQFDIHLFGWKGVKATGELFALQDFKQLDVPVDPREL